MCSYIFFLIKIRFWYSKVACWKALNCLDGFPTKTPRDSPARALQTPDPLDWWPKQCHYVPGSMAVGRVGTGRVFIMEDMGGPPGSRWTGEHITFWLKVMMFSTNKELQYLFRADKLNNVHILLSNPRFELPGVKLLEAESCHVFFYGHRFWTNATGFECSTGPKGGPRANKFMDVWWVF